MLSRPDPTCAEVRRELAALALREMPAADAALVRGHVASCRSCARDGAEVLALVGGLRSAAGPRPPAWSLRAACAAALAVLLIVIARDPQPGSPVGMPAAPELSRAPAVAGLLAVQAEDGAWREDPRDGCSLFTVGLSGLATVGCLGAGVADDAAEAAARRGCDFLVLALAAADPRAANASPELQLRAHAAAAWALGLAALRWPERYRNDAIEALRRLARLRDDVGPTSLVDVTTTLVSHAYQSAAAIGITASANPLPARPPLLAARFAADSAPVTRLAAQVLADASRF